MDPQNDHFSAKIQNFKKCQKGLFWPFLTLFDQNLTLKGRKPKILKKSTKIFQNFKFFEKIGKNWQKNRNFKKKSKIQKIQNFKKIENLKKI